MHYMTMQFGRCVAGILVISYYFIIIDNHLDNKTDSACRIFLHGDGSVEGSIADDQSDVPRVRLLAQIVVNFGELPTGYCLSVDLQNLIAESVGKRLNGKDSLERKRGLRQTAKQGPCES